MLCTHLFVLLIYMLILKYLLLACRTGFVQSKYIMELRQQLNDHGYCKTFTTDEKGEPCSLHLVVTNRVVMSSLGPPQSVTVW